MNCPYNHKDIFNYWRFSKNWIKKTYLVGTSSGNKGVSCEVGEKEMENTKRLSKRQTEETKA